MQPNPYQAPDLSHLQHHPGYVTQPQVVAIRQDHLATEASIKGIGSLYIVSAILLIPSSILMTLGLVLGNASRKPDALPIGIMAVFALALGVLQLMTGLGLRRRRPWARVVGIVLSSIGLLGFPVGTLISVYFLVLLAGRKGSMIFSPAYQQIIDATPGMRYKTSIVTWIVLIIFLVLVIGGAGIAILRASQH